MSTDFQSLWSIPELKVEERPAPAGEVYTFPDSQPPELSLVQDGADEDTEAPAEEPLSESVEALIAAAREEALSEGLAQGREEAQAEAQAHLEGELLPELEAARARIAELESLLQGLSLAGTQEREQLSEQATRICVDLSRRVLGDTLLYSPETLSQLVTRCLSRFPSDSGLQVLVPPGREEQVRADLGSLDVEVVADPSIQGGCRVRNEGAEIDQRLSTLMAGLDGILEGLVPAADAERVSS